MFHYFLNVYFPKIQGGHMPGLRPLPASMDVAKLVGFTGLSEKCGVSIFKVT
jgi:hypothetical protein